MSKFEKSLQRLKQRPKDFTWNELRTIMTHFGYAEIKGSGSRRKFFHTEKQISVSLHEPQPRPILKAYVIDIVIEHLKEEGDL